MTAAAEDDTNDIDVISIGEACRLIGGDRPISRATYYRAAQRGRFPKPIHITPGTARVPRRLVMDAIRRAAAATSAEV